MRPSDRSPSRTRPYWCCGSKPGPDTAHSDYPRLIELGQQLRAVESEKAELEDRWLAVAENISAP